MLRLTDKNPDTSISTTPCLIRKECSIFTVIIDIEIALEHFAGSYSIKSYTIPPSSNKKMFFIKSVMKHNFISIYYVVLISTVQSKFSLHQTSVKTFN